MYIYIYIYTCKHIWSRPATGNQLNAIIPLPPTWWPRTAQGTSGKVNPTWIVYMSATSQEWLLGWNVIYIYIHIYIYIYMYIYI